jgi:hypothetical protein
MDGWVMARVAATEEQRHGHDGHRDRDQSEKVVEVEGNATDPVGGVERGYAAADDIEPPDRRGDRAKRRITTRSTAAPRNTAVVRPATAATG